MKLIFATILAGMFLVSLRLEAADQAPSGDPKADKSGKGDKGDKGDKDKKADEKKEKKAGGGW